MTVVCWPRIECGRSLCVSRARADVPTLRSISVMAPRSFLIQMAVHVIIFKYRAVMLGCSRISIGFLRLQLAHWFLAEPHSMQLGSCVVSLPMCTIVLDMYWHVADCRHIVSICCCCSLSSFASGVRSVP
mgnify:CR=1 FL=1